MKQKLETKERTFMRAIQVVFPRIGVGASHAPRGRTENLQVILAYVMCRSIATLHKKKANMYDILNHERSVCAPTSRLQKKICVLDARVTREQSHTHTHAHIHTHTHTHTHTRAQG